MGMERKRVPKSEVKQRVTIIAQLPDQGQLDLALTICAEELIDQYLRDQNGTETDPKGETNDKRLDLA